MKSPIKRKSNYHIAMLVNTSKEVFIQVQLNRQIKRWINIENEQFHNDKMLKENVRFRVDLANSLINLEEHRKTRSTLHLVQLYWVSNLSMMMIIFDTICLLILQLCLTWMPRYSFLRIVPQWLNYPMMLHCIYCFWIYHMERKKECVVERMEKERYEGI